MNISTKDEPIIPEDPVIKIGSHPSVDSSGNVLDDDSQVHASYTFNDNLGRGIEFKYHEGDGTVGNGSAQLGFFGFDTEKNRYVFYKEALNNTEKIFFIKQYKLL